MNLDNLSYIDFEDLCRDLVQAETGKRFSAFSPGPDEGVDGRHSKGDGQVILQCKHYSNSSFSSLKRSAAKELDKIRKLNPKQYIFITSSSLNKKNADDLITLFDPFIKNVEDVWGRRDIESALTRHPDIVKAHIKLWLSNTAVLEKVLHSGLEAFTDATKDEILEELKVYVKNPSLDEAIKKLERERVLIVSGPPGVGKTTLAKMVAYNYLHDGWSFHAIHSLDDGFLKIEKEKPVLIFFDDFLGRIELSRQSLLQQDTAFSVFVKRVRKSKNARFILTTRAHIFEEARRISDHLDDRRLQLAKYLLDVGAYTRRIKAHIFFNHLSASEFDQSHLESLLEGDWLARIIDHENYNPRIISSISSDCLDEISARDYPAYILNALNNPDLIWDKPYRALNLRSQNLLIAVYFSGRFGTSIGTIREVYSDLHRLVSRFYAHPTKPTDFEDSLHALESGFVSISGERVSFVNPSVSDFLKSHLGNRELLLLLPSVVKRADWAMNLWRHLKEKFYENDSAIKEFVYAFEGYANIIDRTPVLYESKTGHYSYFDASFSDRIEMLFEWWDYSKNNLFLRKALSILQSPYLEFSSWREGSSLPLLHHWVGVYIDDDNQLKLSLLNAIESRFRDILKSSVPIDELTLIFDSFSDYMSDNVPYDISMALDDLVRFEFKETREAISHLETEDELSEHLELLDSLSKSTGYDLVNAKAIINDKINELEEPEEEEYSSSYKPAQLPRDEKFNDKELKSLFSNLMFR